MDQQKIGRFLAELRKNEGMTQESLGEKLGVTNKTISRWETGTYMPDMQMFLALSKLYNISINELLSGERLSDISFREKSDENTEIIVKSMKSSIIKVIKIAITVFVCLNLCFISVYAAIFINNRNDMLYPKTLPDEIVRKTVMSAINLNNKGRSNTIYEEENKNILIGLYLPENYKYEHDGLYKNNDSYIKINTYYISDFQTVTTNTLMKYFENEGIKSYSEKVIFSYMYNIESIRIFNGREEIETAAGCRLIRGYNAIENTDTNNPGGIYRITGEINGFAITSAPEGSEGNVWSVFLEDNFRICHITVCDNIIGGSSENMAEWLSAIRYYNYY